MGADLYLRLSKIVMDLNEIQVKGIDNMTILIEVIKELGKIQKELSKNIEIDYESNCVETE